MSTTFCAHSLEPLDTVLDYYNSVFDFDPRARPHTRHQIERHRFEAIFGEPALSCVPTYVESENRSLTLAGRGQTSHRTMHNAPTHPERTL